MKEVAGGGRGFPPGRVVTVEHRCRQTGPQLQRKGPAVVQAVQAEKAGRLAGDR